MENSHNPEDYAPQKTGTTRRDICPHCGLNLSTRQIRNHKKLLPQATAHAQDNAEIRNDKLDVGSNVGDEDETPGSPIPVDPPEEDEITQALPSSNFQLRISDWQDDPQDGVSNLETGDVTRAQTEGQDESWNEMEHGKEAAEAENEGQDIEIEHGVEDMGMEHGGEEDESEQEGERERPGLDFQQEHWIAPDDVLNDINLPLERRRQEMYVDGLDKDIMTNLTMFSIRTNAQLPRNLYNVIRAGFREQLGLLSEFKLYKLMDDLSGLKPIPYDCCIQSCCIFVGDYKELNACPSCQTPRYRSTPEGSKRVPQQVFHYIPLVPRLQAYFRNAEMQEKLLYRAQYDEKTREVDQIQDVFDCKLYRDSLQRKVVVNGLELEHKHFSDHRDIALGLSGDGIQIFRRVKFGHASASVTPLILINYNLPPNIRTHNSNVIPLGIIPGPKGPSDTNSFLWPLKQELDSLSHGISTYDSTADEPFRLHAHLLYDLGDIPWINKTMGVKGQNARCPCRSCDIVGFRDASKPRNPYYSPLRPPIIRPPNKQPVNNPRLTPATLTLRTHEGFKDRIDEINGQRTQTSRKEMAKQYGVNEESILYTQSSMRFPKSFPWEFMHLFFENLIPNLIALWKGKFGQDVEVGPWRIPDAVWLVIGVETAASVRQIPSSFVGNIPNIATDEHIYKAEFYSFWFVYLAPILLRGRLPPKYYDHACDLARIIKLCLSYKMSRLELGEVREGLQNWVAQYEKIYYQYKLQNLPMCLLTTHALLHVADDIKNAGPVWATWTFVMERYAGSLLPAVKSRLNPYGSLAQRVKRLAQLQHIKILYDLDEALDFRQRMWDDDISCKESIIEPYENHVLRFPRQSNFKPPPDVLKKVAIYFVTYAESCGVKQKPSVAFVKEQLPEIMPRWGKVRIVSTGERIRGSFASVNGATERNSSYIRFVQLEDKNAHRRKAASEFVPQIYYGQLHYVLDILMPKCELLGIETARHFLLAYITPCKTSKPNQTLLPDATKEVVSYKNTLASVVVDLELVENSIGRVLFGTIGQCEWAIIDRSGDEARTSFADDGLEMDS